MTRLVSSAAVAAFAVLTASCAPTTDTTPGDAAAARSERPCFLTEQVRNFRADGSGPLYVRAGRDEVFQLNNSGGCFDLNTANSLIITGDPPLSGSRICTGDWARIGVPGSSAPGGLCRARVEGVLTPEQLAALPSRLRP